MNKAHNVVLCERLKSEKVFLTGTGGYPTGELNIVKPMPPIPSFEQSASALAPFPLPKVPIKVSQYWTFKTGAGDTPTLPVVAFQIYSMHVYDEFIHLLRKVSTYPIGKILPDKDEIMKSGNVKKLISDTREFFEKEPTAAERMLEEVKDSKISAGDMGKRQKLKSLIKMYLSANSQYLNFYGPPRSITTVPYHQALKLDEKADGNRKQVELKDKAVFVGLSETLQPEQRDGYYTVFSQSDGLDISGVEIAATAFANLMEDINVRPIGFPAHIAVILLWGVAMGILCRLLPAVIAASGIIGLGILYLIAAEYQFKTAGIWYPTIFTLFFQPLIAFFGAVSWKYIDANRERQNIKKAFGYYMPEGVVDQLAKNIADIKTTNQLVYGICLSTDAEHYTSLSEKMGPRELGDFMNKYYEAVFNPVKLHDGIVSNVIGDSMLAIWVAKDPDTALRGKACLAALDISKALQLQFNRSTDNIQLPTRIGLHSGDIFLGNIGAVDHYEYRPVGDIVNTATRIESLNKHLGTRILVSEDVIDRLEGFETRELGKFLLVGKSKPIIVYELLCRTGECEEGKRISCSLFAGALQEFRRQEWGKAEEKFKECIRSLPEDGPSHFYLKLCGYYRSNPPGESWNGAVHMDKK